MTVDPNSLLSTQVFWDSVADTYEQNFTGTIIGRTRREAVRCDLAHVFSPGDRVLELNCGTGLDAVFLASRGVDVVACDIAPRMIDLARQLAANEQVSDLIDFRVLATEQLSTLAPEAPFDGAFSNFSGLNCVANLSQVAADLGTLLKPGASVLICMMGRFVPCEIAWFLAHGNPTRAFQRLRSDRIPYSTATDLSEQDLAHQPFIQRPSVVRIRRQMSSQFKLRRWKGIGITVPPSYAESWAARSPRLINRLAKVDRSLCRLPLLRSMADLVLLEFERRSEPCHHVARA